jgi:hypothetical protein
MTWSAKHQQTRFDLQFSFDRALLYRAASRWHFIESIESIISEVTP